MEATNIFAKLATKYEAGFDDFLPKRVQILAKGFAEGWDLVRVNEKLLEEECETLYARSFFEAGLIFAYDHGMSYPEWEELFARCMAIHDDRMESGGFTGGKIPLQQLKQYAVRLRRADADAERHPPDGTGTRAAGDGGPFFAVYAGESGFFLRREGKGAVLFL